MGQRDANAIDGSAIDRVPVVPDLVDDERPTLRDAMTTFAALSIGRNNDDSIIGQGDPGDAFDQRIHPGCFDSIIVGQ